MNTETVNGTQMTLEECMPEIFQNQTVGALDFRVRTYQSETAMQMDFRETVHHSFSELCTFVDNSKKKKDPLTCSLRTLKICLVLMEDGISPGFSLNWTGGGYDAQWQVINSKHHGVAQNRERCFIVGCIRKADQKRIFPIEKSTDGVLKTVQCDVSGKGNRSVADRFYLQDGIMATLSKARAQSKAATIVDNKVHLLTARERMRLQGWTDDYIDRAYLINEPIKIAEQAGNGVTVTVIEAIAKKMKGGD